MPNILSVPNRCAWFAQCRTVHRRSLRLCRSDQIDKFVNFSSKSVNLSQFSSNLLVDGTQLAFWCPFFLSGPHFVFRRTEAMDGKTFQRRNACPLVSHVDINTCRPIEPPSAEVPPGTSPTSSSPSHITTLASPPKNIDLAPLS